MERLQKEIIEDKQVKQQIVELVQNQRDVAAEKVKEKQ